MALNDPKRRSPARAVPHGSSSNFSAAPRIRLGVAVRPSPPPTPAYAAEFDQHRALWSELLGGGGGEGLSVIGRRALGLEDWPVGVGAVGGRHDHSGAYLARIEQHGL
jgi:hypothetical protein